MSEGLSSSNPPGKRIEWLVHVVGWGILLTFPFLFTGRNTGAEILTLKRYLGFLFVVGSFVIVFYFNYLYLVRRFLFIKQVCRFLLINFLATLCLTVGVHLLLWVFLPEDPSATPFPKADWSVLRLLAANMVAYFFVITIAIAYKATSSWYTVEAERKELERSHSEAELQNLKSQLNPHFLFNTLNNIYSLIASSPERAQEVVHELSRLLRYVLYESSQAFVPIGKDLDFIRNYVELMRIRLPGHVSVEVSLVCSTADLPIAPLLFIAPIENAFKHGVSNNRPSFIRIEIEASNHEVHCHIVNSYFPKSESDKSGSGIGLINLDKRLNLIYPGQYAFSYRRMGETYHCTLNLHLKKSPSRV
ncbi:MAG: sensor histidine kinase [Tannerellaceae bacterium]|jgi:hypothetical protein|nr:sensor histidine kinase [Tannerellaceae bacterium]